MSNTTHLPYRDCVGIMLLNPDKHVWVGQRIDQTSEAWQMPQGGIDEGEDPKQTALRELEEETGTTKVEIIAELEEWLTYDLPEELIPKLWGGKYRGQRQKWFAMRFLGTDNDINIQTQHPEFLDWKWVPAQSLPKLIVPFKRELYSKLITTFTPLINNAWKN